MGAHISIDPETRIIDLITPPTGSFVILSMARDIYSEAKEDWLANPELRRLRFPLREPVTALVKGVRVGPFVFLDNAAGWRIRPYDANHELTINGDFLATSDAVPLFVSRPGRTILVSVVLSARSQSVQVSGNAPWNELEKAQLRYVLGVDGATLPVTTKPDLVNWLLDEELTEHDTPGTTGELISLAASKATIAATISAALAVQLERLLGLNRENAMIDMTTYNERGQLLSGRLRVFDSRTTALAATPGGHETDGLIATYSITSEYSLNGQMLMYRMTLEP